MLSISNVLVVFLFVFFFVEVALEKYRRNRQRKLVLRSAGWEHTVEHGNALRFDSMRLRSLGQFLIENIFLKGCNPALYLAQSCEWCLNVPAFIKSCVLKCRNNTNERFFHIYGMFYPQTPPVKPMVIWNSVTFLPKLPEAIGTIHPFWDVLLEHKQLEPFLPNASQTNSLFCPTSLTSVVCSTLLGSEVWKKKKKTSMKILLWTHKV